jgi:hypothetical protein
VLYEIDKRTGLATEFSYTPCGIKNGSNICRHNDDTLNVYITSSIIINNLLKEHSDLFTLFQIGNGDGTLLFKESDIGKVVGILKIQIRGRCQSPRPKRKLNLTDEQRRAASDRMKEMQLHKKKTAFR